MSRGLFNSSNYNPLDAPTDFAGQVLRKAPQGSAPLFALSTLTGSEIATAPNYTWSSRSIRLPILKLGAGLPVAPAGSNQAIIVDNVDNLVPGHTLQIGSSGEQVRIESIQSDTQIVIRRGFGSVPPQVATPGDSMYITGNAHEESSLMPLAVTENGSASGLATYTNCTQIVRNSWGLSGTVAATTATTSSMGRYNMPVSPANNKQEAALAHARDIEMMGLFGQYVNSIRAGQPIRAADGLISQISKYAPQNVQVAGPTTTFSQFQEMLNTTLQVKVDESSDNSKVIWTGNKGASFLQQMGRILNPNIQSTWQTTTFGLRFRDFQTDLGDFTWVVHPLLNLVPEWSGMMLVLDMPTLKWKYLSGRQTAHTTFNAGINRPNQDTESSGIDAMGGTFLSELSLKVSVPEANAVLYGLCTPACEPCAVPIAAVTACLTVDKPCHLGKLTKGSVVTLLMSGLKGAAKVTIVMPDGTKTDMAIDAAGNGVLAYTPTEDNTTYNFNVVPEIVGFATPVIWKCMSATICTNMCLDNNDVIVPTGIPADAC